MAAATPPLLTFDGWLDLPREMRDQVMEQLRVGARARDVASARGLASLYATSQQMRREVGVGGLDYDERQSEEALLCYALLEPDHDLLRALSANVKTARIAYVNENPPLFVRGAAIGLTNSLGAVLANDALRRALMSDIAADTALFNTNPSLITGCFCGMVRAGRLAEAAAFISVRIDTLVPANQHYGDILAMTTTMAKTPGAVDALFPLFPFFKNLDAPGQHSLADTLMHEVGKTGNVSLLSWILAETHGANFHLLAADTVAEMYKIIGGIQTASAGACFDVLMADARFNHPTAAVLQNTLENAIKAGSIPALEWLVTRGGVQLPDEVTLNAPLVPSVAFIGWLEARGVAIDVSGLVGDEDAPAAFSPALADWLLRRGHRARFSSGAYFDNLLTRREVEDMGQGADVEALLDTFLRHNITIPRYIFRIRLLDTMLEGKDGWHTPPIDLRWAARQGFFRDYDGGILASALSNPDIHLSFLIWARLKARCVWPSSNEVWRRFACLVLHPEDPRSDDEIEAALRYLLLDERLPVTMETWVFLVDTNSLRVARLFLKYGTVPTPTQRVQLCAMARANGQEKMEALLAAPTSSSTV